MNLKISAGLVPLLALSLAGCQAVNDGLTATNQALGSINAALAGAPGTTTPSGGVYVPPEVKQKALAALVRSQSQEIQKQINDAQPAIVNMVSLVACGAESNRMTRYTDTDSSTMMFVSPFINMHYHKSGCLTPIHIHGWEKRSSNAISFMVDYVSPQSDESTRRNYVAVKQPSGEWLFRW